MTLQEAVDLFILSKKLKLVSKYTIASYGSTFKTFISFVGQETPVQNLSYENIKDYILLRIQTLNRNSLCIEIMRIKGLLKFLEIHEYIDPKLNGKIETPKNHEQPIRTFSANELFKMDSTAKYPKPHTDITLRTCLIYWIIRDTGIRSLECCQIRLSNIDLNNNTIYIQDGKGGTKKTVPFTNKTKQFINRYILKNPTQSIYLLQRYQRSASATTDHITRQTIYTEINKIIDYTFDGKWDKRKGPHLLRHAAATEWIENGGNILALQWVMGWSNLTQVNRYVRQSPELIKRNFIMTKKNCQAKRRRRKPQGDLLSNDYTST